MGFRYENGLGKIALLRNYIGFGVYNTRKVNAPKIYIKKTSLSKKFVKPDIVFFVGSKIQCLSPKFYLHLLK